MRFRKKRSRENIEDFFDGPMSSVLPAGAPAPHGRAQAKVYWPDGSTQEFVGDYSKWNAFNWSNMMKPEQIEHVLEDWVEQGYAAVVDSKQRYDIDEYVVLYNDYGKQHYMDWLRRGLVENHCPWKPNPYAWGLHGPVIVMPRSSYP